MINRDYNGLIILKNKINNNLNFSNMKWKRDLAQIWIINKISKIQIMKNDHNKIIIFKKNKKTIRIIAKSFLKNKKKLMKKERKKY